MLIDGQHIKSTGDYILEALSPSKVDLRGDVRINGLIVSDTEISYSDEAAVEAVAAVLENGGNVQITRRGSAIIISALIKNGLDGEQGEQGPVGPQGKMGPVGPKGYTGSRGPKGDNIVDVGHPTMLGVPGVVWNSQFEASPIVNKRTYHPFLINDPIKVCGLVSQVTVGNTGTCRLGIYAADINWQPQELLVDAGEFKTNKAGVVEKKIDTLLLNPGRYVVSFAVSENVVFKVFKGQLSFGTTFELADSIDFVDSIGIANKGTGPLGNPGDPWDITSVSSQIGMQYYTMLRLVE